MATQAKAYEVDPRDPRAPRQEVWDRLSDAERRDVLATLPSEISRAEPPEGDRHSRPKHHARGALEQHFRRLGRRIYIGSELPVYYPGEAMFAPDLIAVLDADPHERDHWTVSHEGRGLDLAIEIHVRGSEKKDFVDNVALYGRLGIPEYFAFAPRSGRLSGWRRPTTGASPPYQPIIPQEGRWPSSVLGLDLAVDGGRLRFFLGNAAILAAEELVVRLGTMVDAATKRAEDEARRAEDEARRAEDEAGRAARYAAKLRELGVDPDGVT